MLRVAMAASAAVLGAIFVVGLGGCGKAAPPSGKVQGKVTVQGKSLEIGRVQFVKPDGVPVGSAKVNATGEFQFDAPVPVGEYRVAITPPGEEAPAGAPDPQLEKAMKAIPPKYRNDNTSGFKATVKEGDNSFTFDMQ